MRRAHRDFSGQMASGESGSTRSHKVKASLGGGVLRTASIASGMQQGACASSVKAAKILVSILVAAA
eukprot:CAMPEP_0183381802 /NCGR_PEP_ID=MMETSP0164_2-20130417/126624_1 /TAXON_ID=221442 /ORGANISM="Coccolithus pelagicus ssp braarudi, Strain PLY182g" /LENGTH=66 /DNA_ID=CAMNT_0025559415 /DNA_START=585 /DNA_END=781 /DNA_ORIENTATION=+